MPENVKEIKGEPLGFVHYDPHKPRSEQPVAEKAVETSLPWSSALPPLDADKVASARRTWIASGHSAEAYDAALAADGFDPVPDDKHIRLLRDHNLTEAKPADYSPKLEERFSRHQAELSTFAAELKLNPGLGSTLIERLAEVGPKHQAMSKDERTNWLAQQTALAKKLAGGTDTKLAEVRELAKAVLARFPKNRFASDLRQSDVLNEAFTLLTLAHQERSFRAFDQTMARKAKAGKK